MYSAKQHDVHLNMGKNVREFKKPQGQLFFIHENPQRLKRDVPMSKNWNIVNMQLLLTI